MPLLKSQYSPPYLFRNYHISTIFASVFRKAPVVAQKRQRMELEDGDFIDLDWSYAQAKSRNLLVVLHGLEGNAQRPYILGMASKFTKNGWNVAAVNLRGCSGEPNRLYKSYNAGASKDLEEIVNTLLKSEKYQKLAIIGFSLGGNLLLKYLGEGMKLPQELKTAMAISAPCDLYQSLKQLEGPKNKMYSNRFVKKLKKQLYQRAKNFPNEISNAQIENCNSLFDIDNLYTSRAHGFKDAHDYYKKSSSLQFLPNIKIPVLLLNAKNDAFLSKNSSPTKIAEKNPNLYLETPKFGGHVGFLQKKKHTYAEERAVEFVNSWI